MKQTAVEWLYYQIEYHGKCIYEVIEQAKEMEKEQIIESYCIGCAHIIKDNNIFPRETSEQYYNETYEQSKQG